jgi:hypothetical protein
MWRSREQFEARITDTTIEILHKGARSPRSPELQRLAPNRNC